MKKLFAVLLALTLVLSMGTIALAADTGSITITNAVKDYNYTVYKMLDFEASAEDSSKGIYKIADGWNDFIKGEVGSTYFSVADNGSVTKIKDPDAALARAAVDYAKNAGGFRKSETAADTTVTFSGLDLGYYAVDTTVGAICSLTNTNSKVIAVEKNALPTLEKKIVEGEDLVDANNVAIGDDVDYQITFTVGNGLTDYVVKDTMSAGLTYNEDAKAYIVGDDASLTEIDAVSYTVTETENGFEVSFGNDYIATVSGKKIVIKFSAELNNDAVVGSTGNPNTAKLDYKNESVTTSTPDDTVITYTTKLTIDKIDGVSKQPLKGAGFTLYKGTGDDKVAIGEEVKGTDLTSFVWSGLAEGTYTLVETTVPGGYNKAADIVFTITCEEPETVDATTDTATWTSDNEKIALDTNASGTFKGTVENKTGSLLPETGGIGTTIFYVVGGLLMAAAFILLVSKKRMANFA